MFKIHISVYPWCNYETNFEVLTILKKCQKDFIHINNNTFRVHTFNINLTIDEKSFRCGF